MSLSTVSSKMALLATDRHGSVLHLHALPATPPMSYTAFGYRLFAIGLSSMMGFNGQLQEQTLLGYLLGNGYRLYNPVLMRFVSPDSLSPFFSGGGNAYVYCGNDPMNTIDPSGHVRLKSTSKMWIETRKPSSRSIESEVFSPSNREVGAKPGNAANSPLGPKLDTTNAERSVLRVYELLGSEHYVRQVDDKEYNQLALEAIALDVLEKIPGAVNLYSKAYEKELARKSKRLAQITWSGKNQYRQALDVENKLVSLVSGSVRIRESANDLP